jgi:hypothetical protein
VEREEDLEVVERVEVAMEEDKEVEREEVEREEVDLAAVETEADTADKVEVYRVKEGEGQEGETEGVGKEAEKVEGNTHSLTRECYSHCILGNTKGRICNNSFWM